MDPSFTTVRVRSSGGSGILATNVSGFTVVDSLIDENDRYGIAAAGTGTAASTLEVTGTTFASNVANGIGTNFADASSQILDVPGSSFTDNNIAVAIGVTEDADTTFDLDGNTALRSKVNGIQVLAGATSTANAHVAGSITNNTIGDADADSGARDMHGIGIEINDDAVAVIAVTGNQIRHVDQQGIFVDVRDPIPGDLDPATASLDLHLRDNTIADIDDNSAFRSRSSTERSSRHATAQASAWTSRVTPRPVSVARKRSGSSRCRPPPISSSNSAETAPSMPMSKPSSSPRTIRA